MTKLNIALRRFAHLAVDWDEYNVSGLPEELRTRKTEAVCAFRDRMREKGVPTIWVSYPFDATQTYLIPPKCPWTANQPEVRPGYLRKGCGVGNLPIYEDEAILVKNSVNAFIAGELDQFLKTTYQATDIYVTGGYTPVCVRAALEAGLNRGYNMYGMYDLMYSGAEDPLYDQKGQKIEFEKEILEIWRNVMQAEFEETLFPKPRGKFHLVSSREALLLD